MTLPGQMIKLARPNLAKNAAQRRRIRQIAVMEEQIFPINLCVQPQMLDPRTEQVARPPHDPVNSVAFLQKQLGQIRAVLSGDAGDQRGLTVNHGDELTTEPQVEKLRR